MRIFVGGLPPSWGDHELHELLSEHGTVQGVRIIKDHETKKSKCYGFADIVSEDDAHRAIAALDGRDVIGNGRRKLTVNEAKPRSEREAYVGR